MRSDPHDVARSSDVPGARGGRALRRVGRIVAAHSLHTCIEQGHVRAETFGQIGHLGLSIAQRPGHSGRTGDVGCRDQRLNRRRAQLGSRWHGVELRVRRNRPITHQQVVVDLHDDEALGRKRRPGSQWHDVLAVARCPGAQPRHRQELAEPLAEHRGLAEAGPPLAIVVGRPGIGHQIGRNQEEDGMVHLFDGRTGSRKELARNDERVLGDVRVDERAVVVIGAAVDGLRCVWRGGMCGDRGDLGVVDLSGGRRIGYRHSDQRHRGGHGYRRSD